MTPCRAFVFLAIILLYMGLYKFLRRPDTIQVSTEDVTSFTLTTDDLKRDVGARVRTVPAINPSRDDSQDAAPWEKLVVADVGDASRRASEATCNEPPAAVALPSSPVSHKDSMVFAPVIQEDGNAPEQVGSSSMAASERGGRPIQPVSRPFGSQSTVGPSFTTSGTAASHQSASPDLTHATRRLSYSYKDGDRIEEKSLQGSEHSSDLSTSSRRRPRRQTMQEFFAQYQLTSVEIEEERVRRLAHQQQQREQQSASSYFNRQASLLMLYIPLAYLFLFTFSLVRLIYDMVTSKSSPFLSVSSLWAVLSVGLVDALLYVSAEPCGCDHCATGR
jgi:hypothetical protein